MVALYLTQTKNAIDKASLLFSSNSETANSNSLLLRGIVKSESLFLNSAGKPALKNGLATVGSI
ncbi:MAG: hypothetical protein DRQ49_02670 [Gammaproteobacteria bacterium]|nr:MAG: hypothetical protein DRQ49_02670 [Gammaproteobacteria bacterium]RKZ76236.1 MAG: hypothetical protein DRQ57_04540 [Gammaproteobacteria bacterium]